MSGTEWVRKLPDDVLERFWKACVNAEFSVQSAAGAGTWVLIDDLRVGMARERDAWRDLAFVLELEKERREHEPQEVQA